jgi:hypothetical protein
MQDANWKIRTRLDFSHARQHVADTALSSVNDKIVNKQTALFLNFLFTLIHLYYTACVRAAMATSNLSSSASQIRHVVAVGQVGVFDIWMYFNGPPVDVIRARTHAHKRAN